VIDGLGGQRVEGLPLGAGQRREDLVVDAEGWVTVSEGTVTHTGAYP
jgi:hypothetical protein